MVKVWYRWAGLCMAVPVMGAVVLPSLGYAHESRPAYVELTEQGPGLFDVRWRRPARGDRVLSLRLLLPDRCRDAGPRTSYRQAGSLLERWRVDCSEVGMAGQSIEIGGLPETLTDVLVRASLRDGSVVMQILRPATPRFRVQGAPSGWQVGRDYGRLGVEHILGGVDHLLFVLGLLLILRTRDEAGSDGGCAPDRSSRQEPRGGTHMAADTWRLVKTVTAFTVAHSITLGLATLGFVDVPQAPVEAAIALSILFLATELATRQEHEPGVTQRSPWVVAFLFGLLHGFGFAGALAEVGLPPGDIPLALVMFNLGVEAGQLLFIAGVLSLAWAGRTVLGALPCWAPRALSYGIGSIAAYWVIARMVAFW